MNPSTAPAGSPTHGETPASDAGLPPWIAAMGAFMLVVGVVNGGFVWLSSRGHRDLVRPDYYEAGLKQDSLIALAGAVGPVSLRREGGDWLLEGPAGSAPATRCRLRFYRPDDGRADREVVMRSATGPAGRETWRAPAVALRRGRWIVTAVRDRDGGDVREKTLEWTEP